MSFNASDGVMRPAKLKILKNIHLIVKHVKEKIYKIKFHVVMIYLFLLDVVVELWNVSFLRELPQPRNYCENKY